MKRKLQTTFLALLLSLSVAAAPSVWADDFDDDDLGVGSFDVLDDSDREEGSFRELQDGFSKDNGDIESYGED